MRLNLYSNLGMMLLLTIGMTLTGCFMKPSGGKNKRGSAAGVGAAPGEGSGPENGGGGSPSQPAPGQGPGSVLEQEVLGLSSRSDLRFKPQDIMESEIADVLALPATDLCQEPGGASCTRQVHLIALAGVDPYNGGPGMAIEESMVTTPIAWERVILSACAKRAEIDTASPASGKVFVNLPIDSKGNLSNVNAQEVASSIDNLYRRAVKRAASPTEIGAVKAFYEDVRKAKSEDSAREWARLSCYAVLTSLEFVFY